MVKHIFASVFVFLSTISYSQNELIAFFEKAIDTVTSNSKKEINHTFKIIIPNQNNFKNTKVEFEIEKTDMSPGGIFLPNVSSILVGSSEDTIKQEFIVKFNRSDKDDRILILKLKAKDSLDNEVKLADNTTEYKIYIKPQDKDSLNDSSKYGYEFWLFTGTNLDLLDGAKLKELYFKGSYLFNIRREDTSTSSWVYFTFGKNRYFSEVDSFFRLTFSDIIHLPSDGDSAKFVRGLYNTRAETITDNIFASINYLCRFNSLSSKKSQLFLSSGVYIGLQTLTTKYKNQIIGTDTSTIILIPGIANKYRPILGDRKLYQFNYNLELGFMHILSTEKINVKTHFTAGLNSFNFPSITRTIGAITQTELRSRRNIFTQFRIEGTVLNPGISIGFEAFLRAGTVPLFNASLTKVLTFEQLGTLFGKVPTTN